ncbi:MAG: hypothetical protein ACI9S9_000791 [Planctomycetota bacterium]|jgi:hypothetical protein
MTDPRDEALLGADLAAICARYGAPIRCEHERGILRLMYEGDDGGASHGSVEMADGVVHSARRQHALRVRAVGGHRARRNGCVRGAVG